MSRSVCSVCVYDKKPEKDEPAGLQIVDYTLPVVVTDVIVGHKSHRVSYGSNALVQQPS
jgi:hypothetical protein